MSVPAPDPAPEQPICNVFCLRPRAGALGDEALFQQVRRHVYAAFGPWVNLISLPLGGGSLGRAGITSRTVYEFNHCGHGLIICGSADARNTETLDVDPAALATLELPILGLGLSGRRVPSLDGSKRLDLFGLREDVLSALASRMPYLLCRDNLTRDGLAALGQPHGLLGGCPTLSLEARPAGRNGGLEAQALMWEAEAPHVGALVTVRDPARMGIPASQRAEFVGALRDLLGVLRRAGHSAVRLLCVDPSDLPFATSLARNDFLLVDEVATFMERMRACTLHVTFREDVALMCAALGHPFVHLACSEEARRPLETAGLHGWSLPLDDVEGLGPRVLQQASRFDVFSTLRLGALPEWAEMERRTARLFRRFATDVLRCRTDDLHRRPLSGGALGLEPDETRVEVRRTPPRAE